YPLPLDLNFKTRDRISGLLAALTLLVTMIALLHGGAWWLAPLITLSVIALLNGPLFRFLAHATSLGEAILCFPLLLIYLTTCVAGLVVGIASAEHRQDRWL